MEILSEIVTRRSVRKFTDKNILDEQIRLILEAARMAPSGSNMQPWDFIVVKSREMKEKIVSLDHNQKWMLDAPVFIICIGNAGYRKEDELTRAIRDSAIATDHMLLQIEHMGLSTCWTGWYEQEEMRELLGLDDNCYVTGVLPIGYGSEKPAARPRRELIYKVI